MSRLADNAVYLIDSSVYIFRAWFSYPDDMRNRDGQPTNAVYGYTRFLVELLERHQPKYLSTCYDLALNTSLRNDIYPEYKANRDPAPPELEQQMAWCREISDALGITRYASTRYEADDLIGTLAHGLHKEGLPVVIISADKDLAQLLDAGDHLWDYARDRLENIEQVEERMGVPPSAVADLLALTGDKVDNIPGIPGVGPKTACALLRQFGSIDGIYAHLSQVPFCGIRGAKSVANKLVEHRELLNLSRELTGIFTDAPIDARPDDLLWQGVNVDALEDLMDRLGFGQGLRQRCRKLSEKDL